MPRINSPHVKITTTMEKINKSSIGNFQSSPSEWNKGVFINITTNKKDRTTESQPFSPVYIIQDPKSSGDSESPTVFFMLDNKEDIVAGVFNSETDKRSFSSTYPEKSLTQILSILKMKDRNYGVERAKDINTHISKTFSSIVSDNSILKSITLPLEISSEKLDVNFQAQEFTPAILGSLYQDLLESGIDIKVELKNSKENYEKKIHNILDFVNDKNIESKTKKEVSPMTNNLEELGDRKKKILASSPQRIEEKCAKIKLPRVDETTFKKNVREDTIKMNRECRKFWSNITPEEGNPMQEELSRFFARGKWIMLTGDSGIGKSYNPQDLAERNNIPFVDIKLHKETEQHHLAGTKELSVDIDHEEMDTSFMTGPFIRALINAAEGAKKGKGLLLLLDELLRVRDNSLFISGFSEVGAGEYGFEYGEGVDFRKIITPLEGPVWFKVSDFTEKDTKPYEITKKGNIYFHDTENAGALLFSGEANECAERCWRGKIPSISREEYRVLIRGNHIPIVNKFAANQKVYVPSKALYVVGTTNVGSGYTVNMQADIALGRRFFPLAAQRPPVAFMIKSVIKAEMHMRGDAILEFWTPEIVSKISTLLETFFTSMDTKIAGTSADDEIGQIVNFSMVKGVVSGLSDKDPLNDKYFGIVSELTIAAKSFAALDFGVTTEVMERHSLVKSALASIIEIQKGGVMHKSKGVNASKKAPDIKSKLLDSSVSNSSGKKI